MDFWVYIHVLTAHWFGSLRKNGTDLPAVLEGFMVVRDSFLSETDWIYTATFQMCFIKGVRQSTSVPRLHVLIRLSDSRKHDNVWIVLFELPKATANQLGYLNVVAMLWGLPRLRAAICSAYCGVYDGEISVSMRQTSRFREKRCVEHPPERLPERYFSCSLKNLLASKQPADETAILRPHGTVAKL